MARIAGVDLPGRKHIWISLQYIFGIGPHVSKQICAQADIDPTKRADDLDDAEVKRIREVIEANFKVEGDARRERAMNIKRLMDLGCYRGLRHRREPPGSRSAHSHQRPYSQGPAPWRHVASLIAASSR